MPAPAGVAVSVPEPSRDVAHAVIFCTILLLTRVAILATLAWFTGQREFTDDAAMHMGMVRDPLAPLLGRTDDSSHPPLMGLLLAAPALPLLRFASEFITLRLTSILYEAAGAYCFARLAQRLGVRPLASAAGLAFLVMPMGWMTSAVMAQDESIALVSVMATAWLLAARRNLAALAVLSLGVASGKILLAVPLAGLILLAPGSPLWKRFLAGGAPAAAIYAWAFLASVLGGTRIPLVDFNPGVACSVSLWVFAVQQGGLSFETARRLSGLCVAGSFAAVMYICRRSGLPSSPRVLQVVLAVTLLWTFALFFHINPEYYVMVLPLLLLVFRSAAAWLTVVSAIPWAVNFVYGVAHSAAMPGGGGAKQPFIDLYRALIPIAPETLYPVTLAACVAVMVVMAIIVTRRLVMEKADGPC